jgi:hypothetical protein
VSWGISAISSLLKRRAALTVAAERRLHTAQPSLSRQIRDLEYEVCLGFLMEPEDRAPWSLMGSIDEDSRRPRIGEGSDFTDPVA